MKVPYELIGSMPELKVCPGPWGRHGIKKKGCALLYFYEVTVAVISILQVKKLKHREVKQ